MVLASLEWGEEEIFRFLLNVAEHDQSLRNAIEQNIDEVLIAVFKTKAKARWSMVVGNYSTMSNFQKFFWFWTLGKKYH